MLRWDPPARRSMVHRLGNQAEDWRAAAVAMATAEAWLAGAAPAAVMVMLTAVAMVLEKMAVVEARVAVGMMASGSAAMVGVLVGDNLVRARRWKRLEERWEALEAHLARVTAEMAAVRQEAEKLAAESLQLEVRLGAPAA